MPADAYDLAVLGAGIAGCTIAYEYARACPGARIALVERRQVGGGCSGMAGAVATPAVRDPAMRTASDTSRAWFQAYAARHGDAPLEEIPIAYVVAAAQAQALALRLASPPRPATALPAWLQVDSGEEVLAAGTAVRADVAALCRHMVAHAGGLALFEGTTALPERSGAGWRLRLSDGRELATRRLVRATGPWFTAAERGRLGARLKKIVAFVVAAPVPAQASAIYFDAHEAFLLPLPARGCWLLSIRSAHWDCAPVTKQLVAGPDDLALAHAVLRRHAPALLPLLRGARVHCDGYLAGMRPGSAAGDDGAVLAGAGSGSGFRYAPALAGEVVARLRAIDEVAA